jgi:hypothetical protein
MKKFLIAVVIILALGLGAAIYFCVTLNQDKNALTADLNATQNLLGSTQAELASTNATLVTTQTDLNNTKDTLNSTLNELGDTQKTLASTQSELNTTRQQLASKSDELTSANTQITSLQQSLTNLQNSFSDINQQLAMDEETLAGLGITVSPAAECEDVVLVDNPQAHNPTWNELMSFLASDNTEQHEYIPNVYDCSQFSRDLHNNAEAAGIRAAEVQVRFQNDPVGHALDAFITTDYGLVYVDCTNPPDKVARVECNKVYRAVDKYSMAPLNVRNDAWWDSLTSYYCIESDTGALEVVSSIIIYW